MVIIVISQCVNIVAKYTRISFQWSRCHFKLSLDFSLYLVLLYRIVIKIILNVVRHLIKLQTKILAVFFLLWPKSVGSDGEIK